MIADLKVHVVGAAVADCFVVAVAATELFSTKSKEIKEGNKEVEGLNVTKSMY